jgi:hypothetical protein
MNGSRAYPLMRDWANTTGPRSVMDEETNQQQNDDNDNDSSACHLPPFLKIGVDLACLAHARQRVLPQPLSSTTANVSPRSTEKLTPSTAVKAPGRGHSPKADP